MKLFSLKVTKFRGIKSIRLVPNGKNFLIWGPNGSGKSAIVDAIDFVLTGRIPRLTGEGTGGITLSKYGSHIDHRDVLDEAMVRGTFEIPGFANPIIIERKVSDPSTLKVLGATHYEIQPFLDVAQKRQHSLSRRDILKFVAAEAGRRSEEVQAILNLGDLEETRKSLIRVQNAAANAERATGTVVANVEDAIRTTLGLKSFSWDAALARVNELRYQLRGTAIQKVDRASLKREVQPPAQVPTPKHDNPALLKNELRGLMTLLQEKADPVGTADAEIRRDIETLHRDIGALSQARNLRLFELGISSLDGSGKCPLCGHQWDPETLSDALATRKTLAAEIATIIQRINTNADTLATSMGNARQHLERLRHAASGVGLRAEAARLGSWADALGQLQAACSDPIERYLPTGFTSSQVKSFMSSNELNADANAVVAEVERASPDITSQQTAWDTLTRLEANLIQHQRAVDDHEKDTRFARRASELLSAFEEIRTNELESLFASIESRFSSLYTSLHEADEKGFSASLKPEGPSLHLEVDFYGRGQHPPLALHSEGHQDSMGLCLYLALAEKLTENVMNLTVLDDVVMSVDAGHRRDLCTLIKQQFPERQFIITTHDKTWAKQLLIEGVVGKNGYVEFTRWSVEGGPFVELDSDMWARIQDDLKLHDVPAAAARLRNGGERFFEMVCDSLRAKVRYKLSGAWELSDYLSGAISAYKEFLRAAKASSQSWGVKEDFDRLTELETIANQIIQRTQFEQWAVNASVHYNRWHELSVSDFIPVRDAMRDLFELFRCSKCQSLIRVTEENGSVTSIRCLCLDVNWNLVRKPK